jgi:hypothetical protein
VIGVTHHFGWADYELVGPLTLSLDDYTIKAFGCDEVFDYLLSRATTIRHRSESIRWMLVEFWGRGKSTLMYNFCNEINKRLFFSSPTSPILALYVNYPKRAEDLLDYSYDNGLPFPWEPGESKVKARALRRELFVKALRIIAYAWVRKAASDEDFNNSCSSSSSLQISERKNLIQNNPIETIQDVDKVPSQNRYKALAQFLDSFFEYSFKRKSIDNEGIILEQTLEDFPGLLYPESTSTFLVSFSRLFGKPGERLRNFVTFHRLCELVNVHLLLVLDEAEDWTQMSKMRLDDFLVDILPTNRLSVIIILRTEVVNRLRGTQKRLRYYLVRSYMKRIDLRDPNPAEVLEVARGILATCRTDNCLKVFPFTEDFILALSHFTVRGGHFNSRMFLRSLDRILKLSLTWERSDIKIGADFIKRPDFLDAVVENFRIEDIKELESSVLAKAEEIQRKLEAARDVSERLLSGQVNPPTKEVFEIVKEIVSEKFLISILSDIEIIAYSKKEQRAKVAELIQELKEAPPSGSSRQHHEHS